MSVDPIGWDETAPTNGDFVAEGDDNFRALKTAMRTRMAMEHGWPSSQVASNQAGYHTFVTLSGQTAAPSLAYGTASTQLAAIWCSSGSKNIFLVDSAGSNYLLAKSGLGSQIAFDGTSSVGTIPYVTAGGGMAPLAAGASGSVLMGIASGTVPAFTALSSLIGIGSGQVQHAATIPIPAGFVEGQCSWMVSMANFKTASGTSNPDGVYFICSASGTRAVTCVWEHIGAGGSGTGTANYLIIGVAT